MRNVKEIAAEIMAFANDEESKKSSVSIIFTDGEVCSTKGGDLLWQRTMHMFHAGTLQLTWWGRRLQEELKTLMTHEYGGNKYIFTSYENSKKIVKILQDWMQGEYMEDEDCSGVCDELINLSKQMMMMETIIDKCNKRVSALLVQRKELRQKTEMQRWLDRDLSRNTKAHVTQVAWGVAGCPKEEFTAIITSFRWVDSVGEYVAVFDNGKEASLTAVTRVE